MATKLRIRTANVAPKNTQTGEEIPEGVLIATLVPALKEFLTNFFYKTKNMDIGQDVLKFDVGRGKNTSEYEIHRPSKDEIEINIS